VRQFASGFHQKGTSSTLGVGLFWVRRKARPIRELEHQMSGTSPGSSDPNSNHARRRPALEHRTCMIQRALVRLASGRRLLPCSPRFGRARIRAAISLADVLALVQFMRSTSARPGSAGTVSALGSFQDRANGSFAAKLARQPCHSLSFKCAAHAGALDQ
jgi:hypothetical protein